MALCSASPAAAASADEPLGRLNWGVAQSAGSLQALVDHEPESEVAASTSKVLKVAEDSLSEPLLVIPEFQTEGILFTDPRYKQSVAASRQLTDVYSWAMCARVGNGLLQGKCRAKAVEAVNAWVGTYKPTGNPINEAHLIPLLQAIDLARPLLDDAQSAAAMKWLAGIVQTNDAYYAKIPDSSANKINNHATWGFSLRAIEAAVLGDPDQIASSRDLLAQHLQRNIRADGSTYDFVERDALHYHQYDLQPLVQVLEYVPGAIDAGGEALILKALELMQPYVTGSAQHVEFVGSKVRFDAERRNAGDPTFATAPWQLKDGAFTLLMARAYFPTIRPWTQAVVEGSYTPRVRQLAALYAAP